MTASCWVSKYNKHVFQNLLLLSSWQKFLFQPGYKVFHIISNIDIPIHNNENLPQ